MKKINIDISDLDIKEASAMINRRGLKQELSIWIEEWSYLYQQTVIRKPKSILEIGSYKHFSSLAFLEGLLRNGSGYLVSLDIKFMLPDFYVDGASWIKIQESSHSVMPKMISKFDMILVDGCHGYNETFYDIINSIKLLNKGGVIYVHDANYGRVQKAIKRTMGRNAEIWSARPDLFHGLAIYHS